MSSNLGESIITRTFARPDDPGMTTRYIHLPSTKHSKTHGLPAGSCKCGSAAAAAVKENWLSSLSCPSLLDGPIAINIFQGFDDADRIAWR